MADLEHGQAIEFEFDAVFRMAMITDKLSGKQEDVATHVIEYVDMGPGVGMEERVRLVSGDGLLDSGSGILYAPWCPDGVPYKFQGYHLPPLPEHKEHRCTDTWFLIVFLAAICLLGWIMVFAVSKGDIYNLHHAFDYEGNMCGIDYPKEKKYGFWCMAADGQSILTKYTICVEHCPNASNTSNECYDPELQGKRNVSDYDTQNYGISPFCWPVDTHLLHQAKAARQSSKKSPAEFLIAVPKNAWMIFPLSTLIAVLVGYTYLKLLQECVDFIVVALILCSTFLSLVVGCWQLWSWTRHDEDGNGWLYGLGLISISAAAFRLFCSSEAQSAVNNAAGCIEAACECINQDLSMLWEPLIALVIRISLVVALLGTMILLVTCGGPRSLGDGRVRKRFEISTELDIYLWYVFFMLFWLMEMCTSMSQYVLAWVTERWYFTPYVNDQKLEWRRNAVCRGYAHMFRKHLGTIAMGSLAICLIRIPRCFLKLIRMAADTAYETRNPLCVCLTTSFCVPCVMLSAKLDHVSKNAYLGVALTSENFIRGACSAYHTLHNTDEAPRVAWLNGMQGLFQIGGLAVITAASGIGTLMATHVFNFFGPDIKVRNVVMFIATAIGFPIGIGYMTLFDTVGDTILYCWAVQQRRFSYHVSHSRGRAAADEGMFTTFFVAPFLEGDDSLAKVNYAPPALRELVLGRHNRKLGWGW